MQCNNNVRETAAHQYAAGFWRYPPNYICWVLKWRIFWCCCFKNLRRRRSKWMHVITTQAVNIQCWMVGAPIKNTSTNNRSCTPPRCSHLIWWMWFGARCCCLWCRSCWCLPIAEEEEERRGKFKNFSSPQLHLPKTYKTLMTESNQHQQDIRKLVFSTPKSGGLEKLIRLMKQVKGIVEQFDRLFLPASVLVWCQSIDRWVVVGT